MEDRYLNKENYITRDPHPDKWRNHFNADVLKIYNQYIHGDVLDFGCNHGSCSFLICESDNVNNVIGIDLNCDAIKVANKTKETHFNDYNINFICTNILNFNMQNNFDTITTFHTLEHIYIDDLDEVIGILYKSLKDGGHLIVSIPYNNSYDGPEHTDYYDEKKLEQIMVRNGFKTIICENNMPTILNGVFVK